MAASKKSLSKQEKKERREDRISKLPDKVLLHILSFLSTKQSAGTSILSKRWRSTWVSVPVLDFDDSSSLHPQDVCNNASMGNVNFLSFVHRVMGLCRGAPLRKFRLKCTDCYIFYVNSWIGAAMERGLEEMDVCINCKRSSNLIFVLSVSLQQLPVLKLGMNFSLLVPPAVHFPFLKTLHLNSILLSESGVTTKLFSSCPLLEELLIKECGLKNIKVLNVCAPALKSLTIECAFDEANEYNTEFCEYEVVVEAPALENLKYADFVAQNYTMRNLCSLIRADILVVNGRGRGKDVGKSGFELLSGISFARDIILSDYSLEVFSSINCRNLLVFSNLSCLGVDASRHCAQMLPFLLEKSPNLQVLTLFMGQEPRQTKGSRGEFEWKNKPHVPSCLLHSLKSVILRGFDGQKNVIEFLRYLVENGRVLTDILASPIVHEREILSVSRAVLTHLLTS